MTDDLQAWSYANWLKVPKMVRQDCLGQLRADVPADIIAEWKAQHARGEPIGGDGFHFFGGGMSVRNILRKQITDGELPVVNYYRDANGNSIDPGAPLPPNGFTVIEARNWDDYYMGAIQELLETTP